MADPQAPDDTPAASSRRDRWNFFVKDIIPHILAYLFLIAAVVYSFITLLTSKGNSEENNRAWTIFSNLLTGVLGYVFGKNSLK